MGFQHPQMGRVGRWLVLPFGAAQSPAIFCEMTQAAADIFNRQLKYRGIAAETLVYVDDFLIIAHSHEDVRKAFDVMDEIGDELGLTLGFDKDVGGDAPCQALEFLGFWLDALTGELTLPGDKAEKYSLAVSAVRGRADWSDTLPRKQLEKCIGQLCFVARVTEWGFLFLQNAFDATYSPFGVNGPVAVTDGLIADLDFWVDILEDEKSLWQGVDRFFCAETELVQSLADAQIFTDASTSVGWGAVFQGTRILGPWHHGGAKVAE